MSVISGRNAVHYKQSTVANFLKEKVKASGKTLETLGLQCGYNHPNNISMITSGRSKIAIDKVPLWAKALNIDEAVLLDMVVEEYCPSVYSILKEHYGLALSDSEKELVILSRNIIGDRDFTFSDKNLYEIVELFKKIKKEDEYNKTQ